jgi:hypothetical protein
MGGGRRAERIPLNPDTVGTGHGTAWGARAAGRQLIAGTWFTKKLNWDGIDWSRSGSLIEAVSSLIDRAWDADRIGSRADGFWPVGFASFRRFKNSELKLGGDWI